MAKAKTKKYAAGWIEHPSTHFGHYFDSGDARSLCGRAVRSGSNNVKDDGTFKCAHCLKRLMKPRTKNLFEGESK